MVATDIIVRITNIRKIQKINIVDELDDFINQKCIVQINEKGLGSKMMLSGKFYHEVKELLNVSHGFISECKNQALFHGV